MDEDEIGDKPTASGNITKLIYELATLAFVAWLIYMFFFS